MAPSFSQRPQSLFDCPVLFILHHPRFRAPTSYLLVSATARDSAQVSSSLSWSNATAPSWSPVSFPSSSFQNLPEAAFGNTNLIMLFLL